MAAPSDDSFSSDDDDHMSKIKEAVCFTTSVQKKSLSPKKDVIEQKADKEKILRQPSRRPDKDDSEEQEEKSNFFQTTPGFRKHIANKLIQSLDRELDASSSCFVVPLKLSEQLLGEQNTGVRLFGSSCKFLSDKSEADQPAVKRRRKVSSSSSDSSEDDRLAEASVSHDFVLQQSSIPFHALRKPADIVISNDSNPPEEKCTFTAGTVCEEKDEITALHTPGIRKEKKKSKKEKKKNKAEGDAGCDGGRREAPGESEKTGDHARLSDFNTSTCTLTNSGGKDTSFLACSENSVENEVTIDEKNKQLFRTKDMVENVTDSHEQRRKHKTHHGDGDDSGTGQKQGGAVYESMTDTVKRKRKMKKRKNSILE